MKAVGCDLYNFALTGGVACALNANTGLSANHAGPSVLIEKEATVFSIGSMNSEGMLSDNPKSGIHETTVARTVCASGSNPTGWQDGDIVVIKKSSDGGVKGAVSILPDSRTQDGDGGTSAKQQRR